MSEPGDPHDPDLIAAEYVLGALPPEQARALEALAIHDAAIARSIAEWQDRLAPLAAAVPAVQPPAVLWRRLALATGIETIAGGPAQRRRSAWQRPGLWRAATALSMAVAASLAFLLLARPPAGDGRLLAALSPAGSPGALFLVRVEPDGQATVVATGALSTPSGRALELWALNAGATVPVSLGLIPDNGRKQVRVPGHAGTELMISQEPAGGSPTGKPTGPVVYAGLLTGT